MRENRSVMELLYAIQENNEAGVRKIIDARFDVNSNLNLDTNPLLFASSHGKKDMVEILINAGADINKQNSSGDTALIAASRIGNIEVVKYLINAGADIDKQNSSGDTALIAASRIGNIEAFKDLINAGADLNKENTNKETAIMIAGNNRTFFSEIRALLSKNPETTNKNAKAQTQAEEPRPSETQAEEPKPSETQDQTPRSPFRSQTLTPTRHAPMVTGDLVFLHSVKKVAQLQSSFAKQPPSIKADLVFKNPDKVQDGIRERVDQLQSAQQSPSGALNSGTQSTVSAQLGFVKSIKR